MEQRPDTADEIVKVLSYYRTSSCATNTVNNMLKALIVMLTAAEMTVLTRVVSQNTAAHAWLHGISTSVYCEK